MSINILIIGGARSGKSSFAQELAVKLGGPILFVATAEAKDEEMRRRIEAHKRSRSTLWNTLESPTSVGSHIGKNIGQARVVIVDCVTLLVNNVLCQHMSGADEKIDTEVIEQRVTDEITQLIDCMNNSEASFIVVTNEVGAGLVPASAMARLYRDLLGKANQMLGQHADHVYLMVAGLPLQVKP
jgi:adenosylcobinamide kinase/adenosylcobinamide-phosphate guanylyltransferase